MSDLAFPLLGTLTDVAGSGHPVYHDGVAWHPLGEIQVAYAQKLTDVVCAAGNTVTVVSVDVGFTDVVKTAQLTVAMPFVDLTATSGGDATFTATMGAQSTKFGYIHSDRAFGWPVVLRTRMPIPGPGSYTVTVEVTSGTGGVTVHASDDSGPYAPVSLGVAVVA